jgi:hypothetical protein
VKISVSSPPSIAESSHRLAREVAKHGDGIDSAWIVRLLVEQITHVGAEPRHAEESGLVIDEPIQCGRASALRSPKMYEHAWIQIAPTGSPS